MCLRVACCLLLVAVVSPCVSHRKNACSWFHFALAINHSSLRSLRGIRCAASLSLIACCHASRLSSWCFCAVGERAFGVGSVCAPDQPHLLRRPQRTIRDQCDSGPARSSGHACDCAYEVSIQGQHHLPHLRLLHEPVLPKPHDDRLQRRRQDAVRGIRARQH